MSTEFSKLSPYTLSPIVTYPESDFKFKKLPMFLYFTIKRSVDCMIRKFRFVDNTEQYLQLKIDILTDTQNRDNFKILFTGFLFKNPRF